jgi:hypothetical protein
MTLIYLSLISLEGLSKIEKALQNESLINGKYYIQEYRLIKKMATIPSFMQSILSFLLKLFGKSRMSEII